MLSPQHSKKKALDIESQNLKFSLLKKLKKQIKEPVSIHTPLQLRDKTTSNRFKNYTEAKIIKRDHDRLVILDFLLSNLFRVFLLLHDRHWQEAFMSIYANLTVVWLFNEFIICIKHTMMLAVLLQKMELEEKSMMILEYLRDLVEDTNNNKEAILVYEEIGKLMQEKKEYALAILAFKKMLQIAWQEDD